MIIIGFFVFTDWLFMFGCNGESWGGDHHFEEVCRVAVLRAKKIRISAPLSCSTYEQDTNPYNTNNLSTLRQHLLDDNVGVGSMSRNGFLSLTLADNEIEPDRMSDQISLFIESTVE